MKPLLSTEQLKKLQEHKYKGSNDSFADNNGMDKWFNLVANLLPLWLAPNVITAIGSFTLGVTSIIHLSFCPHGTEEVPVWVICLSLFGLFTYQTLDNVDGIHARRTKSSNSLGELFDHGLDMINSVWVTIIGVVSVGMGQKPYIMMFVCFLTIARFGYTLIWQQYASGAVKMWIIDATDGQLFILLILGVTAFFGLDFWNQKLVGTMSCGEFVTIAGACVSLVTSPWIFYRILKSEKSDAFWRPCCPLLFVAVSELYIALNSKQMIFEHSPVLYIMVFSLLISKIATKLLIASMSQVSMELFDIVFIVPIMLFMNQLSGTPFIEDFLLWIGLGFITANLCFFWIRAVPEICHYTGWFIFKINYQHES